MGSIRIEINTAQLDDLIERLKTAPATIQKAAQGVIGGEASHLTQRIRDRWPVDTGYSKPLWRTVELSVWRWLVTNRANYAGWVHAKGDKTRTPILYTWIATEIARSRAAILLELRALILQVVRTGRAGVVRGGRLRV